MKNFRIHLLVLALIATVHLHAQKNTSEIYIKGSRFTTPLVQKWINEYEKQNPGVKIVWADKNADNNSVDLSVLTYNDSLQSDKQVIYVGRYALLPIAGKNSLFLAELSKKNLNKRKIKELFFREDVFADDQKDSKSVSKATVYSGNGKSSATITFAAYFGYKTADIKGRKISGDDQFLINAVEKDQTGVTFNSLNYIYDTNSRKLRDNIALLPLDVKKEQRKVLASENIDQVIDLLENQNVDIIPVQDFGFLYSKNANPEVGRFVSWVLDNGLIHNHNYGFLKPTVDVLVSQKKQVEGSGYLSSIKTK
nr:hypothetical protein [uncultured Bacteroides sp.]